MRCQPLWLRTVEGISDGSVLRGRVVQTAPEVRERHAIQIGEVFGVVCVEVERSFTGQWDRYKKNKVFLMRKTNLIWILVFLRETFRLRRERYHPTSPYLTLSNFSLALCRRPDLSPYSLWRDKKGFQFIKIRRWTSGPLFIVKKYLMFSEFTIYVGSFKPFARYY